MTGIHEVEHEKLGLDGRIRKIAIRNCGIASDGGGGITAETDPVVGAINGLVKSDGAGNIAVAIADTDYLVPATAAATYQPLDADLTAIAALGFTATAFLKKTAANTWALDTNTYLPLTGGTLTGLLGQTIDYTTEPSGTYTYIIDQNIDLTGALSANKYIYGWREFVNVSSNCGAFKAYPRGLQMEVSIDDPAVGEARGAYIKSNCNSNTAKQGTYVGIQGATAVSGSAAPSSMTGTWFASFIEAGSTAVVPNTFGHRITVSNENTSDNGGKFTTAYGNYVEFYNGAGATASDTIYGYYATLAGATTIWGLYISGDQKNYLTGNLGLGVDPTTNKLQVAGNVLVKPTADSTTVLQVQNALGTTTVFTADTTNNKVILGSAATMAEKASWLDFVYSGNTDLSIRNLQGDTSGRTQMYSRGNAYFGTGEDAIVCHRGELSGGLGTGAVTFSLQGNAAAGNVFQSAQGYLVIKTTGLYDIDFEPNSHEVWRTVGRAGTSLYNTGFNIQNPLATVHIVPDAATDIPLIVQGYASQSDNLQQWRDNSVNILARIDKTGTFGSTSDAITLAAAVTTFAQTSNTMKLTGDAGANTITTITGGISGQLLTLIFVDALITITDTAAATANTVDLSAAFTSSANDTLTLVYDGNKWFEVARSIN